MQTESVFYMVWNSAGRSPTMRHGSHDAALAEAKRLATVNPGCDFYVLTASKLVKRAEPVVVVDLDDGLPF